MSVVHNLLFPDQAKLLGRVWLKDAGAYSQVAPALANLLIVDLVGSGGEGQDLGGNGAFARRRVSTTPGEAFTIQVGQTHSAGNPGNSWIQRSATGEFILLADRGHGTGEIQGLAVNCSYADYAESGQFRSRSGGDSIIPQWLGFGGRWAANLPLRAAGPGGGGWGQTGSGLATHTAGQGLAVLEWYTGDPGF